MNGRSGGQREYDRNMLFKRPLLSEIEQSENKQPHRQHKVRTNLYYILYILNFTLHFKIMF